MNGLFRLNQRVTMRVLAIMFDCLHVDMYLFWCKLNVSRSVLNV